ncbi:MAG: DUF190 domain-containing protein [Vulcanimicrobiaceae bacterium]
MDDFEDGRLLRIFVDETDRHGGQPLYTAIVEFLRSRGALGAIVFRAVEGYGSHGLIHAARAFAWQPNLPILIEVVERQAKVEEILPELRELAPSALLTDERVRFLHVAPRRS